jgi:hypothetical protein
MGITRRELLQTSALVSLAAVGPATVSAQGERPSPKPSPHTTDAFERACGHMFLSTKPGPTYFEGMLLGNGMLESALLCDLMLLACTFRKVIVGTFV